LFIYIDLILKHISIDLIVNHIWLLSIGLSWVAGDAQNLPAKDNSFDAYTIAFGIRNVTRMQEVGTI
jgi:hypothetical protein